ncbi:helix-turn-helix transcriptional regulator [Streptomyces sp. CAU 1734]|uniref:helix-turn-helix domain-containing protein n=1 Tax=Streptomyces sp. CAU 1734 TaxID=3140360 RepID=UPI003261656D
MAPPAFGQRLRSLRIEAGRTQGQQAEAVNAASGRTTMTRREISRYETGRNIPTPRTVAAIAVACGLHPEHLENEAAAARARRSAGEDDDVRRRTLIEGGVAALGAAAAAEPWGRLAHALGRGTRIDTETADGLTGRTAALHISELRLSAQQLRGQVVAHLDAITAAIAHAGPHRRELVIAAGETAALAGWLAWDMGDHQAARAYYRAAADCADDAGHPPLRALALAYASYGAAGPAALALLTQAAQDVRGPGSATAAAWVNARTAEETAASGDETGALRALDRARTAYDYADPSSEQAWVAFMSPARMDAMALSVYGRLAHPDLADAASEATDRLGRRSEAGVVILGDVAAALLQSGDQDRGVGLATEFAEAASTRPNTMGQDRLRKIAARLPDGERDLSEHLRKLAG